MRNDYETKELAQAVYTAAGGVQGGAVGDGGEKPGKFAWHAAVSWHVAVQSGHKSVASCSSAAAASACCDNISPFSLILDPPQK